MSVTIHERPGVYSSYTASTAVISAAKIRQKEIKIPMI